MKAFAFAALLFAAAPASAQIENTGMAHQAAHNKCKYLGSSAAYNNCYQQQLSSFTMLNGTSTGSYLQGVDELVDEMGLRGIFSSF